MLKLDLIFSRHGFSALRNVCLHAFRLLRTDQQTHYQRVGLVYAEMLQQIMCIRAWITVRDDQVLSVQFGMKKKMNAVFLVRSSIESSFLRILLSFQNWQLTVSVTGFVCSGFTCQSDYYVTVCEG